MPWGKRSDRAVAEFWVQALAEGDAGRIEAALIALLPGEAKAIANPTGLETVMAWPADAEQVKTLDYWQRARWGRGGESQALQELRRVFAHGPQWRSNESRRSGLPPLYPD